MLLSITQPKTKCRATTLEELCCADASHGLAEQGDGDEAVDEMDAMYEGPAEAMPGQDHDMAEEEQQRPEPMQQDKVLPSVNSAGVRDDLAGAQGTPKALASSLVCHQVLLVHAICLLAQPCFESLQIVPVAGTTIRV